MNVDFVDEKSAEEKDRERTEGTFRWLVNTIIFELSNKNHFTNCLATGFAIVYFILVLHGRDIPERFETIVIMILSFYFGTKMKD